MIPPAIAARFEVLREKFAVVAQAFRPLVEQLDAVGQSAGRIRRYLEMQPSSPGALIPVRTTRPIREGH